MSQLVTPWLTLEAEDAGVPGSSAPTSKSVFDASALLPHLKRANPLKALNLAHCYGAAAAAAVGTAAAVGSGYYGGGPYDGGGAGGSPSGWYITGNGMACTSGTLVTGGNGLPFRCP